MKYEDVFGKISKAKDLFDVSNIYDNKKRNIKYAKRLVWRLWLGEFCEYV